MPEPLSAKGYTQPKSLWWTPLEDEEIPELRWPASIEVYDRMRRADPQVTSVLRAVTLPVRRTPWRIDGEGCDPQITQMIAEDLGLDIVGEKPVRRRTKGRFSWKTHLRLALLMLPFGHAYFEHVWQIHDGKYRLRKLELRPSRTISKVDVAADGGLVAIEQFARGGGKDVRLEVERLVAYVNDREGGNWLGQSLLRPAYGVWLLKNHMLRVQATTVDRNGTGIPVYESSPAPEGSTFEQAIAHAEQEMKAGLKLAQELRSGESAGAAIASEAKLRLMGVEGKLPDADVPIRYHDEQIARAVLAHFLNLGTETGSWALGSTFADFFTMSLQALAEDIADITNQHVIEDLVDVNFGETEPAPRLVFDEIGSKHPVTAEALQSLLQSGALSKDDELEAWTRDRFGIPMKSGLAQTTTSDSDSDGGDSQ